MGRLIAMQVGDWKQGIKKCWPIAIHLYLGFSQPWNYEWKTDKQLFLHSLWTYKVKITSFQNLYKKFGRLHNDIHYKNVNSHIHIAKPMQISLECISIQTLYLHKQLIDELIIACNIVSWRLCYCMQLILAIYIYIYIYISSSSVLFNHCMVSWILGRFTRFMELIIFERVF